MKYVQVFEQEKLDEIERLREINEEEFNRALDNFLYDIIELVNDAKEVDPMITFYISVDSLSEGKLEMVRLIGHDDMPHLIVNTGGGDRDYDIDMTLPGHVFFDEEYYYDDDLVYVGRYYDKIPMLYKVVVSNKDGSLGLTKI